MGLFGWLESLLGKKAGASAEAGSRMGSISKELLYGILDINSSGVLFFTKKDGWIGANKAFFEMFDYENIDAFRAAHESIRELFASESEEVFTEYDKSWLDYIRTHRKGGYGVVARDRQGRDRILMARCRMIKQQGTELYILELEDITALELARNQAQEVERLKTKFLSNIGHEFRTPMNGILGFIEILEKSNPTEQQAEYIKLIHTSARSLMNNIESLLDLAQMQGGRLKVIPSEFNPVSEFEELAHLYAASGKDRNIAVSFFIDPKLPEFMEGDLRKVKQVLGSLVGNALKFTPSGGKVHVEIKLLKRHAGGKCSIGFSVKDNGPGIAKDRIALITQPFVTGDQADERLGVGLSLSHGLVQLLGGKLSIQSDEGKGATFTFALDFERCSEKTMQQIEHKTAKVVLLDEKRIEDANLLTAYLRSFGLNVIKVNLLDEITHSDADMAYLVTSPDRREWFEKLERFPKSFKVTLFADGDGKFQGRYEHLLAAVLRKPLVPTRILKHLTEAFDLSKPPVRQEAPLPDKRHTALVAEDNLINQRLIKILLKEYGIDVTTVANGAEAVSECSQNPYDVVFMDIDMPVKDGILATQEIKALGGTDGRESPPVIALTAMAMEGDREHILEQGLDDYLSKPLTRDKLEYILGKYLHIGAPHRG